ncbi:PREDICTED: uncharacterized protein LOC107170105 [Diuraphis noxia]|uniref:uncharacterized protein LOC107170105 n=1 Tax=Diuraphis noxia TaxID=143948 RepID=UPI0007638A32|nr:PREDICTED: uncharacterized protein LOC107170105 [Diuraphis noxia]
MGDRFVIWRAISEFTICVKLSARNPQPIMADLPDVRVQQCHPFSCVGIDYAGPLLMKETSLRKVPQKNCLILSITQKTASSCALPLFVLGILTPPPSAPHFGGLRESAVRSTKLLLVRVIGNQVLYRVESAFNSRPLTPASNDPNDLDCLSPVHFLTGRPLCAVPEEEVPVSSTNLKNHWKFLHQVFQAFWRHWSNEYLHTLQNKGRWLVNQENVKMGELVIIKDNKSSPLEWKLGGVHELIPGQDGVVRVVKLLTQQGLITKLVPLPTQ